MAQNHFRHYRYFLFIVFKLLRPTIERCSYIAQWLHSSVSSFSWWNSILGVKCEHQLSHIKVCSYHRQSVNIAQPIIWSLKSENWLTGFVFEKMKSWTVPVTAFSCATVTRSKKLLNIIIYSTGKLCFWLEDLMLHGAQNLMSGFWLIFCLHVRIFLGTLNVIAARSFS
jgi:hypothetical protein